VRELVLVILSIAAINGWTWTQVIDGTPVIYRVTGIRNGMVRYSIHAQTWPVGMEETGTSEPVQFYKFVTTP